LIFFHHPAGHIPVSSSAVACTFSEAGRALKPLAISGSWTLHDPRKSGAGYASIETPSLLKAMADRAVHSSQGTTRMRVVWIIWKVQDPLREDITLRI